MSPKDVAVVKKLAQEAEKAARVVTRNHFLIETYMSLAEARSGKRRAHSSVSALFRTLEV